MVRAGERGWWAPECSSRPVAGMGTQVVGYVEREEPGQEGEKVTAHVCWAPTQCP